MCIVRIIRAIKVACIITAFVIAFYDNKRYVVLDDGKKNTYYYISMIPTNWYEWFDPDQPEDDSWINVCNAV